MFRNKELRQLIIVMLLLSVLAISVASFISPEAMWLVAGVSVAFIGITIVATLWRYREIRKLSGYLRAISSGDYTLDVRDNHEGELSILKSEIYKVTQKLAEHKNMLQQDKTNLTDAISDISHQLKTPLTSMGVMTDLLENPNMPKAKRQEFTHNISIQLERIDWLVTSLLKLSKIDAGTIQFKEEQVHIENLIEKALDPLLIPIDINNQVINIHGRDTISFRGDFNWTVEALTNILKNCIEHTPSEDNISINFSENTLYTEIIIEDTGSGIPKEDLPYIFNRFHKGKHASEGSVGIGLAMAYSIISSQAGTIDVTSEEGKGTRFHIKFYRRLTGSKTPT